MAPAGPATDVEEPSGDHPSGRLWLGALQRVVDVRAGEVGVMGLACGYFFCILASWFIMRPIREQMGVASGPENLPKLYTGTLLTTLAVHPLFAALVARVPRGTFITLSYRFFLLNILIFYAVFRSVGDGQAIWVGRVFFVWTSVFNLFVTSVFWAFMVDVFHTDQAKRLFGFIGIGGTLGGIAGSAITAQLAQPLGPTQLLLVSAVLLEIAVQCVRRLNRVAPDAPSSAPAADPVIGGTTWAGISHVLGSPYLLNICLYMLLFTVGSTVLYFQQAQIAERHFTDRATQTAFFARLDLAVQLLTAVTQAFLTGRLIKTFGLSFTLALLPALSVIGFVAIGAAPAALVFTVFVVFQVLRRAGEYSYARPAREVLYTVISREDKYKAKHFIDTFVYRGGDQIGAWSMAAMGAVGLGLGGTASVAAPLAALWLGIALWLGRRHQTLALRSGAH